MSRGQTTGLARGASAVALAFGARGLVRVVRAVIEARPASRRVLETLGFDLHALVPTGRGELLVHILDRGCGAVAAPR